MVADYFPKNRLTNPKDGINDKFNKTIYDDYAYGSDKEKLPMKHTGERAKALKLGRSKPSRRLSAQGQDYATRDKEHMGRNPDGSKRIIPKNIGPQIRPS